jgi:ribosomal protein S18 acetylase RimI-like enzyme
MLKNIISYWNNAFGNIFTISERLLAQNFIGFKKYEKDYLFLDNNKGFVLYKFNNKTLWISLILACDIESYSILLKKIEEKAKFLKLNHIKLFGDYNHFFPAVSDKFSDLKNALKKNNYASSEEYYDVSCNTGSKILIDKINEHKKIENNIIIRKTNNADTHLLKKFMNSNFPGRWEEELEEEINFYNYPKNYFIMILNNNIIGFARVYFEDCGIIYPALYFKKDDEKIGGIGPIGIDKNCRGSGLGTKLLANLLEYLIANKVEKIIIDWTNALDFYGQFGFEVLRKYTVYKKM